MFKCKCGHCAVLKLQNFAQCFCCREIEQCIEALEEALEEEWADEEQVGDEIKKEPPLCVTKHPGFKPVCLEKWSLRYAAGKFRTRQKKQYNQKDSEQR